MRKVIKLVTFLMFLTIMMMPGTLVKAGSINEYEAELLEFGNSVFTYNGVEYIATEAAKERVRNYLMQNDVNLSASQAEQARNEAYLNIATGIADGYLVPLNPSTGDTSGSDTSGGGNSNSSNVTGGSNDTTVPEPEVTYTFKDMANYMYAKQAVNVRTLPSTDGERIGSLSENEQVKVIGQCIETGWYRIFYNGVVAYVSNNYLTDDVPVTETEETEETTEISTEILGTEQSTESVTEIGEVLETEDTESDTTVVETESETETETVLREKNFNKGLNMTTVAMIIGGVALVAAIIVVISHKNRRY